MNEKEYLDTIKLDSLSKNKLKPKIWWEQIITREEKQRYFEMFNIAYGIDNFTFYNYSYLDIINDQIYLFIYKNGILDIKTLQNN